jgi:methylmalonyl-CoA mutase N-terminal domain/subunit
MDTPPHESLDEGRARWQEAYDESTLQDTDFETMSGIGLAPVYGPDDWPESQVAERLGWPGRPPYTRGPYASMYR